MMAALFDKSEEVQSRPGRISWLLTCTVAVAWVVALAERLWAGRLWAGRALPLWIDETWTAMIAGQPDWASFWHEAWLDVNPPLYYTVMALWADVVGTSNIALRLPSLIFVIAAAALPLVWRGNALSRGGRLCWSALLILWWPGLEISLDARGYGLLLLLLVAQLLAFAQVLERPDRRTAGLWSALAAAAILTHYFALIPAAVQGVALLARARQRTVRLWPAALPFLPAMAWLAIHAPRLADYARPDVAWYEPFTAGLAGGFVQYLVGPPGWTQWALIGAALVLAVAAARGRRVRPTDGAKPMEAAALMGVVALLLLFGIGMARDTLTDRYLVPVVPSVLLALVLITQRFEKASLGHALLVLAFLVPLAMPMDLQARLHARNAYGFEQASSFLLPFAPARLVFVWDHPAAKVLDPHSLEKLGRFFFERAGQNPATRTFVLTPEQDGNVVLNATKDEAVIWIYNRARTSSARAHRPDARRFEGRTCQHQRALWIGILACAPVAKADGVAKVTS